jgi:hypothetical protein
LKSYAARLSRMATSLALKCSVSKPLLDDLEKALQKLDLEADNSLINMRENDVPVVSMDPAFLIVVNIYQVEIICSFFICLNCRRRNEEHRRE